MNLCSCCDLVLYQLSVQSAFTPIEAILALELSVCMWAGFMKLTSCKNTTFLHRAKYNSGLCTSNPCWMMWFFLLHSFLVATRRFVHKFWRNSETPSRSQCWLHPLRYSMIYPHMPPSTVWCIFYIVLGITWRMPLCGLSYFFDAHTNSNTASKHRSPILHVPMFL